VGFKTIRVISTRHGTPHHHTNSTNVVTRIWLFLYSKRSYSHTPVLPFNSFYKKWRHKRCVDKPLKTAPQYKILGACITLTSQFFIVAILVLLKIKCTRQKVKNYPDGEVLNMIFIPICIIVNQLIVYNTYVSLFISGNRQMDIHMDWNYKSS